MRNIPHLSEKKLRSMKKNRKIYFLHKKVLFIKLKGHSLQQPDEEQTFKRLLTLPGSEIKKSVIIKSRAV